ncbi:hypothetical protein CEY12_17105 [Chryseobacterium sp. T16E-39]|uniref:hypothetical protein n=1 Tax=Chryseobacterium sp. T16E-39 TaxID=2015076 RepID=UPI000B5B1122|nr:hypothetical protein [Chryseobacterium sp. T16E-39]ASK31726.1 hypothetical protein CEY12_17105 [Chryseobacterium sp. T16E-39]
MKNILLGFALGLATLSFAQQYPNNGWGDDGYQNNNGYYSDQDDQNFPDDYYYNYPQDYYPNDYYQSYYNDYRNSVSSVNWNVFFAQNRLNRWQIDQILYLNNLYSSFSSWNNFYRYNPDRWYYDRFYAMQRILGPRVFITFQNNYYHGSSPIVYFQNYRRSYYAPRYTVLPRYRNININIYRVDRAKFRRMDNPTFRVISSRSNSGFRNNNNGNQGNSGFRNDGGFRNSDNNGVRNNGGFRSDNNGNRERPNNSGFRTNRNQDAVGDNAPRRENNNGFRNGSGDGFRQQRTENSAPRQQNKGNDNRNSGFRQKLANN